MVFGSWVYNSDELTLDYFENMRNVDLNDYVPSGTWDIIDVPASIEYYNETRSNRTKVQMVYRIKMRRKSLFYVVNIIIPTFLISFLSVCVFYLPTDDGEKITLSLSILFALVVFFLLISKIIPPTSIVVPLISKYLLFTFIMNILSVLNTCIVIGFYFKELQLDLMPPWFRFLFLRLLPSLLFIKRPKTMEKFYMNETKKRAAAVAARALSMTASQEKPPPAIISTPPASAMIRHLHQPRCVLDYANSPLLLRSKNTLNRYQQTQANFDATVTTKTTVKPSGAWARDYEYVLSQKSSSQHEVVFTQDVLLSSSSSPSSSSSSKRASTKLISRLKPSNIEQSNDFIIVNYLKKKLTDKCKRDDNDDNGVYLVRGNLYDVEKLKRSPEMRRRFQMQKQKQAAAAAVNNDQPTQSANTNTYTNPNTSVRKQEEQQRKSALRASLNLNLKKIYYEKKTATTAKVDGKKPNQTPPHTGAPRRRNLITFDTFRFTERFTKLCRSVDYISNIYKEKAEMADVIIFIINMYCFIV